jgi:glycosyltransferase involved in cell wall biosynthesis
MNNVSPPTRPYKNALRVVAVIPAYNEARFIGSVVLVARLHTSQVVVVDDGSSDDTARIAKFAGATVIKHEINRGKGAALNTGFKFASAIEGVEAIITIDGDGQHNPAEIPTLTRPILTGAADIVIGSRFLNIKSDIPGWRQIGQHALTVATNLSSGTPLTDSQSGFRAFSKKAIENLHFDSQGFSVESEMQFMIHSGGLHVLEVPISVIYAEPSKRNPVKQGLQVINGILRLVGQYRPLLYFGLGGVFLVILGIAMGLYVVDIFVRVQQLAIGYALISVLLAIMGMTAFSTGIILHSVSGLLRDMKKSLQDQNLPLAPVIMPNPIDHMTETDPEHPDNA